MSNYTTPSAPGAARRLWPPESCGVQPIDQAIARYRQLWDEMWATTQRLQGLNERSTLAQATRKDEEAIGAALIDGKKPEITATNVEQLRAEIAKLTLERGGRVNAVNKAAKLLEQAMVEHRDALDKATAAELDKAEAEWLKACDAIEAAGRRLADARRLRNFAAGQIERRPGYGKPLILPNVAMVRDPASDNLSAALRRVVDPPEPPAVRVLGQEAA